MCKTTIAKNICEFNYSLKRVTTRPLPAYEPHHIEDRREFSQWMIHDAMINGTSLIFVDEVGFKLSTRRCRGRSEVGKPAVVKPQKLHSKNISVMAAITSKGLLHYKVLDGNGNSENFANFIDELAVERDKKGIKEDSTIVLDNVR